MPNCFPVLLFLFLWLWLLLIDDELVSFVFIYLFFLNMSFVFTSSGPLAPGLTPSEHWRNICHCSDGQFGSVKMSPGSFQRPLPPSWTSQPPWSDLKAPFLESPYGFVLHQWHLWSCSVHVCVCTRVHTHTHPHWLRNPPVCKNSCHMVQLYYILISILGTYIPHHLTFTPLNEVGIAIPTSQTRKPRLRADEGPDSVSYVLTFHTPKSSAQSSAHSRPAINLCWIEINWIGVWVVEEKCARAQAFQVKCIVSNPSMEELAIFGWPCTNVVWASFLLLNVTASVS